MKRLNILDLADKMVEMLIEIFDSDNGIVGYRDTMAMCDMERQTHCAAPQPAYNTGNSHSRSIRALIILRAA